MARMTLRQAALDRAEDVGGAAQRDRAEQAFARLDRWFSRFLLLRTTVAATLTVAAAAAALPAIGIATVEDPRQFWFGAAAPALLGWAGALLAVAFGCVTAWPVARTIAGWGWLPQCLRNAELEPFHHIRSLAAAGTVDVIDHAGHAIPADAFRSPWSLALFSAEARHRQLLRSRAADEMDGQLLLREPPAPPVAGPDLPELRQRLDQLGEQIAHLPARPDQEASHTMLAQRIDTLDNRIAALAAPVQTTVQRKSKQPRRHWMADVDAQTFTSRLPLALAAWEGPAAERVKCALQTSFEVNVLPRDMTAHNVMAATTRWLKRTKAFVGQAMLPVVGEMPTRLASIHRRNWSVRAADGPADADLLLTSPPYADAIDYTLAQRLSLYLLGHNEMSIRSLVVEEIGARRKRTKSTSRAVWSELLCSALIEQVTWLKPKSSVCLVLPHKDSGRSGGEMDMKVTLEGLGWNLSFQQDRSIHQSHTRQSWTSIKRETILVFHRDTGPIF